MQTCLLLCVWTWLLLTEGVSYKGCRPLPRWWKADSGCGSVVSCRPQQLNQHHRAELHGVTPNCTLPSPVRSRHMWSWWGPGAAELSGSVAWPGGHFGVRENQGYTHETARTMYVKDFRCCTDFHLFKLALNGWYYCRLNVIVLLCRQNNVKLHFIHIKKCFYAIFSTIMLTM